MTFLLLALGSKLPGLGGLGVGGAGGDLGVISCGVSGALARVLVYIPGVDKVEVGGHLGVKDSLAGRLVHLHGVGEEGVDGHLIVNGCGVHGVLDGAGGRLCGPGWLRWGTRAPFVVVGDLGVAGYGVQGGQDGVGCDCVHHGMVRGAGLGRHLRLYLTANLETVVTRLVISSSSCFRAWWIRTAKCCLMASISCCGVRAISFPAGTMSTSSPSSS